MRAPTFKIVTALAITIASFSAFLTWFPFVFSLAWPGLALARLGFPFSAILTAAVVFAGLVWLTLRMRRLSWRGVVTVSAGLSGIYCAVAFLFAARLPIPSPAMTPYEAIPPQREAYLKGFESGYRYGAIGQTPTRCFSPESETRGFYDGVYEGQVVWWRFLGHEMPLRVKQQLEVSAGRDLVTMDLK